MNSESKYIYDHGTCRCCGSIKKCRVLNVEYEHNGHKEMYSDMLVDCFGLVLSNLDTNQQNRLICATCTNRLRDASEFKLQVLETEKKLLHIEIDVQDDLKYIKLEVNPFPDNDAGVEIDECDDYDDEHTQDPPEDVPELLAEENETQIKTENIQETQNGEETQNEHEIHNVTEDDEKRQLLAEIERTREKLKRMLGSSLDTKQEKKPAPKQIKSVTHQDRLRHELFKTIQQTKQKLMRLQPRSQVGLPPNKNPELQRMLDVVKREKKSLQNTCTLVLNSYVCPFDMRYSDYYCVYCRAHFTNTSELKTHTLNHDPIGYKKHVNRHKQQLIDISRIDCRLCDSNIDSIDDFKMHISDVHKKVYFNVEDTFLKFKLTIEDAECLDCGEIFDFFSSLKQHMADHYGKYLCDICGRHFFTERYLHSHRVKSHVKNKANFRCDTCQKIFTRKSYLKVHQFRMHTENKLYECSRCDEKFVTESLRYKHIMTYHHSGRVYKCRICSKVYNDVRVWRKHKKSHRRVKKYDYDESVKSLSVRDKKKYQCNYCNKKYSSEVNLRRHIRQHHTPMMGEN